MAQSNHIEYSVLMTSFIDLMTGEHQSSQKQQKVDI